MPSREVLPPDRPRYPVDPARILAGELLIPHPHLRKNGVAALVVTDNELMLKLQNHIFSIFSHSPLSENDINNLVDTYMEEHSGLVMRYAGKPASFSLMLKSDPSIEIRKLASIKPGNKAEFHPLIVLPETSDIEKDLQSWKKYIGENRPADFVYDLILGYNPSLDGLTIHQKFALLDQFTQYLQLVKRRLRHGGVLFVQLDENNLKDADETQKIKQHNHAVEIALGNAGFNLNTCTRYLYEKPESMESRQGTLYVFEQEDYADGEEPPKASAEAGAISESYETEKVLVTGSRR